MKSLDEAVQKFKILKQKLRQISGNPSTQTPKFPKQNKENQANIENINNNMTQIRRLSNKKPALREKQSQMEKSKSTAKQVKKSNQNEKVKKLHAKGKAKIRQSDLGINKQNICKNVDWDYSCAKEQTNCQVVDGNQMILESKENTKDKMQKKNSYHLNLPDDQLDSKTQTQKKTQHRKNNSWNCEIPSAGTFGLSTTASDFRPLVSLTSLNSSRVEDYGKELKEKQKTLGEINDLLERKKEVLEQLQRKMGYNFLEDNKIHTNLSKSKRAIRVPNLFQIQAEARKRSKSRTMTIRWK